MTTTQEKRTAFSRRNLVFGITFVFGLTLGVLSVIAIQIFSPQDAHPTQDSAQGKVQRSSTKGAGSASTADNIDLGQFEEIFKHQNVFEQNNILYSTLSSASEEELRDWWIQSQKIEQRSHRENAQDAILRHLTVKNPLEALRYIEDVTMFQTDGLLKSVFSEWSISQLDKAVEVATTLSVPRRKIALQAILETRDDLSESERRSIAKQLEGEEIYLKLVSDTKASKSIAEPQESWEILLNDDVDDVLQLKSLATVAEAWRAQIGFDVLATIFSEVEDFWMQRHLLEAIAQIDPAGALDYSLKIREENEQSYLPHRILRMWARTDAQEALAAVSTFAPSALTSDFEKEIARTWAQTKPNEMIANIEAISEENRVWPLMEAFSNIAEQDPLDALAKLSMVENYVGNTSTIIDSIVREWSRQEPETATDWVLNNYTSDDPQRGALLESVLPSFARQDPTRAFELAIEQPARRGGLGLDYLVIREIILQGDIELATKLLPRVNEDSKAFIYGDVASAMVREGQTDKVLELGQELEESKQRYYYQQVMASWASSYPKNLYESLEDLPTSSLKSKAAMQLITINRSEPVLTDEQIKRLRTFLSSDDEATLKRFEN